MKRFSLTAVLALAACVDPSIQAEQNAAACESSGYSRGTEPFDWCMIKREQAQKETGEQFGQAIALGLQSYGASAQSNYQSSLAARPVSCTTNSIAGTFHTTCR